jgi:hypothetical protein
MRCFVLAALVAAGLALSLLALQAPAEPVHACSCVRFTQAERFDRADSVFAGEATSVKGRRKIPFLWSGLDPVTVEFEVSQVWKGSRQNTLTVKTARMGASCGYEFKEGSKYIVYARNGETGLCAGTAPTWRAFHDIVALGAGWEPEPMLETETPRGGGCSLFRAAQVNDADVGVLALLAGAIALGTRCRPRL